MVLRLSGHIAASWLLDIHERFRGPTAIKYAMKLISDMHSFGFILLLTTLLVSAPAAAAGPIVVKGLVDAGEIMAFEPIRNRVVSQTSGDYVGAEFDATTRRYRFRFLVEGNVVNIDVDARTGDRVSSRKSF